MEKRLFNRQGPVKDLSEHHLSWSA